MPNTIACRVLSYGKYQARAWSHLPKIGVTNVEVPVPAVYEYDQLRTQLQRNGLTATSFQAKCEIGEASVVEVMKPQLEACAAFDVRICFLSVKAGDTPRELVWERLRGIGDVAREHNVIVALETHPDIITSGTVAAETMAAVNHPNVKVNFDTANVYFYNHDVDAVSELQKVIDHVAAVHIKDTNGQYKMWYFPVLGTGVVDFPKLFEVLGKRSFAGPYTMELEGMEGVEFDETQHLKYIADSVEYLKTIGALQV